MQLLIATVGLLAIANARIALSMSWGCLRCLQLALHMGVPRDLASLVSEALGCLVSLHCMQQLLERIAATIIGRRYAHRYAGGYECLTA